MSLNPDPGPIAITGDVAAGKSTVAGFLREEGVEICDADELARQALDPGRPAVGEVTDAFGPEVLDAEGRVDRAWLRRRVLADPVARQRLEAILHPRVRAGWQAWTRETQARGGPRAVVVPLLFETGADREAWGAVVSVCGPEPARRARLAARGWSEEEIDGVLAAQWPSEEKMRRSTYVIWNDGTLNELHENVRALKGRIWKEKP